MNPPELVEPRPARHMLATRTTISETVGQAWPAIVALLDALAVSTLGLLVEPIDAGREEFVALLLSGPLVALALLATGGYRPATLRSPHQAALALLSLLAAVTLPVTFLRLGAETGAAALGQGTLWLALAFGCLLCVRFVVGALVATGSDSARVGYLLLAPSERVDRSGEAPEGRSAKFVTVPLAATPAALTGLAERIERDHPSEIVLSWRLLEAFEACPDLRCRLLDLLLAAPGRVRIALPGGSREPLVLATLLEPALGPGARLAKRGFDLVVACLLLLAAAPLLAIIALAVKLDSPGKVFFRQRRIGYCGRIFRMWKFRTMYERASDPGGCRLTERDDERVTRVGRFLRRTSLDELPQLLNVLTGEMSLVGPRPHPLEAKAGGHLYPEVVPDIARRLRVKPGITGLAQIEGWRGNTDTEDKLVERIRADLRYIESWSFWLDLDILLRTPLASLLAKDAY